MTLYSKLRHDIPWLQLNYLFPGPHHTLSISGSFCIFPHMRIPNSPTLQHGQISLLPPSLFFLFYWGIPSSLSSLRISLHRPSTVYSAEQDSLPPTCPRPASPPGSEGPAPSCVATLLISPSPSCLFHLSSSLTLISSFPGKPYWFRVLSSSLSP